MWQRDRYSNRNRVGCRLQVSRLTLNGGAQRAFVISLLGWPLPNHKQTHNIDLSWILHNPTIIQSCFMDVPLPLGDTGEWWVHQPIQSHPAFNRPLLPLDTKLVTKPTHVPHCHISNGLVSKTTDILTVKLPMLQGEGIYYLFSILYL